MLAAYFGLSASGSTKGQTAVTAAQTANTQAKLANTQATLVKQTADAHKQLVTFAALAKPEDAKRALSL